MTISLGADPEFRIVDKKGKTVPAGMFFPPKEDGIKLAQGKAFRDNMSLEINLKDPFFCRALLEEAMLDNLHEAQEHLPEGYSITTASAYPVTPTQLKNAPSDCQQFGCEPSFDGYTNGGIKVPQVDGMRLRWRFAGGHMHWSIKAPNKYTKETTKHILHQPSLFPLLAQYMDWYIGLPLTYLYSNPEQFRRRKYYGQAGEYRPQVYPNNYVGFEYRTPPGEIWNHHALVTLFFGIGRDILISKWDTLPPIDNRRQALIRRYINTGKGDPLSLIPTINYWYDANTIQQLKEIEDIQSFNFLSYTGDTEEGWTEHADRWGLKIPQGLGKCYHCHLPQELDNIYCYYAEHRKIMQARGTQLTKIPTWYRAPRRRRKKA